MPVTHLFKEDGMGVAFQRAVAVLRACAADDVFDKGASASNIVPARVEPDPQIVKPFTFPSLDQTMSTSPDVPAYELPGAATPDREVGNAAPANVQQSAEEVVAATPAAERLPTELTKLTKDAEAALPVPAPATSGPSSLAVRKTVSLRNARAGEAYSDRLSIEGARDLKLITAGRSGLVFDEESCAFYGTPNEPGDHELRLKGLVDERPAEITVNFAVVPDPKTLWKSYPSDQTLPFAKPDEAFDLVDGRALRMLAASKRGRSHARDAGFREDDFALVAHGHWHIAAVADGAGSASLSRRGSRLAVQTATEALLPLLAEHLGEDFIGLCHRHRRGEPVESEIATRLYNTLVAAAYKAAEALAAEAERLAENVAKLSTTLILTIARRMDEGWFVAGFSIGDGGAAVFDAEAQAVVPLTAPDSGEYAGQTRFLAKSEFADGSDVAKRLRFATPERFTAIALMSDGITDPKLPTDKAFSDPATWMALWQDDLTGAVDFSAPDAEIEAKFLAWLDFWSPGNHDDRTLAVLLPKEG